MRLNDFVTQTEWLPRPTISCWATPSSTGSTWFAHSHAGYAQLQTADVAAAGHGTDECLLAVGDRLGWASATATGPACVAATRAGTGPAAALGPVKVTPYVLGEVAYWQQDRDEQEVTRLYGQAGVRASLPFWKVDPTVQSELLNLNGLAHKVSLEADVFYADASQDLSRFPLYEPLDDDATEHFHRRFIRNLYELRHPVPATVRRAVLRPALRDAGLGRPRPARRSPTT